MKQVVVGCLLYSMLIWSPGQESPSYSRAFPVVWEADGPDLWIPFSLLHQLGVGSVMQFPASAWKASVQGAALPLKSLEAQLGLRTLRAGAGIFVWPAAADVAEPPGLPWWAEALEYRQVRAGTAAGLTTVRALYVPDFQAKFRLTTLLPEAGMGSLTPLVQMAKAHGAVAAINANFYDPDTGLPIGLLLTEGLLQREDYASRGALGVDVFGGLHFFNASAKLQIRAGQETLVADAVNRPPKSDELVLLTSAYATTLRLDRLATIVRLEPDRIGAIFHAAALVPDRRSAFLVATGAKRQLIEGWKVGDPLSLRTQLTPPPPWPLTLAVSAGPMLVRDGVVALDALGEAFSPAFAKARAARSALGVTAEGTLILAIVLKGADQAGMTLEELANWMQGAGAVQALAFDGGGSASLAFRQGASWRNVGGTRDIAVGLALLPR